MKQKIAFSFLAALGMSLSVQAAQSDAADGNSADMWGQQDGIFLGTERAQWLKDSRFGLFVHWGLYSELGGQWKDTTYFGISEWIMKRAEIPVAEYRKIPERFDPVDFDAGDWVQLAKDAGMKHMKITAKHHDGFAMFKSATSPFNIVDTSPFGRDPMKELSEACAEEGIRLGFYYSQSFDWNEKDGIGNFHDWERGAPDRDFNRYLANKVFPQIRELLTQYGPISTVWFDTPGPMTPEQSKALVDLVHELQPEGIVNSRIGNGVGDYETLGDQDIPRLPRPGVWETCDTTNDTWGYAYYDRNFKSAREIAERLVRVVSRGGSYLLNVGPDGNGKIPDDIQNILREVGKWVHTHEEAIHGADSTPFGPLAWGEVTARDKTLFLHVFQWPEDGRLILPGLESTVSQARLTSGQWLNFATQEEGVVITVPKAKPDELIPVVIVELKDAPSASRDQYVLGGFKQTLETATAELSGAELKEVKWMEKFGDWKHVDSVVGWETTDASATWTFKVVEPVSFYLDVEYTAGVEEDNSEWELRINDETRPFPIIDTGERDTRAMGPELPRYRNYRIGIIDLQPGTHTLSISPSEAAGFGARIKALHLTPSGL